MPVAVAYAPAVEINGRVAQRAGRRSDFGGDIQRLASNLEVIFFGLMLDVVLGFSHRTI